MLNKLEKYQNIIIAILVVQTIGLRFAWYLLHPENIPWDEHYMVANNLFNGHGFKYHPDLGPTGWRMPLYPFFLYVIYCIAGGIEANAVVFGQFLIDGLIGLMIFLVAKEIFKGLGISLLAMFLWSIYVPSFECSIRTYAEPLGSLFLLSHIYFFILGEKTGEKKNYILSGLGMGLTVLTRPIFFYIAFFELFLIVLSKKENRLKVTKNLTLVLLMFFLLLTPWVARNYVVFNAFIPTTTSGGGAAYYYNDLYYYDESEDYSQAVFWESYIYSEKKLKIGPPVHPDMSEVELDAIFMRAFKKFVFDHPFKYATNCVDRFAHLWFNYYGWKDREITVTDIFFVTANFLFLSSIVITFLWNRPNPDYLNIIYLVIIGKTALNTLVGAMPRYCLPLWPYCIIFLSYVAVTCYKKIKT